MKTSLLLFLAVVYVAKSFALECYVCDSDFEQNCHNMIDSRNVRTLKTENCDDAPMVGYQHSVCLTTVSYDYYGNRKTIRSCARAGPRKDPCVEKRNSLDLIVCNICEQDLCNIDKHNKNSSIKLFSNMWALLSISVLSHLKKFV